jgi:multiple sugar transport system permease protein
MSTGTLRRESPSGTLPGRRRRRSRTATRRRLAAAIFMAPWAIGFLMFYVYPMCASLYFSFTQYDLLSQPKWTGFGNYSYMIHKDPSFWLAMRNTVWIVAISTPVQVVFAMSTAMVLTRVQGRGASIYRTIFFAPTMVPAVAATLGFLFLLNPAGPLDRLLGFLHLPQPLWFQDPHTAKPGLVLLAMWGIGNTMIIFLAALLDVPRSLYEAAEVEGANSWQRFRFVTLPMISPVIFFSLVIGVIYGFQYFTEAYVAAGGSGSLGDPQGSLLFYGVYLYQQGFSYFHMGYASALAWVLFAIIMLWTLLLLWSSRRWVHYQGGLK